VSSYLASLNVLDLSLLESRTVATTVLVVVGLYLILVLESTGGRRTVAVTTLVVALGVAYLAVLALPGLRDFFALAVPGFRAIVASGIGSGIAIVGLMLTDERFLPGRG
jgi:hypothetical protein